MVFNTTFTALSFITGENNDGQHTCKLCLTFKLDHVAIKI